MNVYRLLATSAFSIFFC